MYYKITKVGDQKYSDIGMVEIMASYYLEEKDEGYDKYAKEYLITINSRQQLNPFRNHTMVFNSSITKVEILAYFKSVSDKIQSAYLDDNIYRLKNDDYYVDDLYISNKSQFDNIENSPVKEQAELNNKIISAKTKVETLQGLLSVSTLVKV